MDINNGGPAFPTENEHQSGPNLYHYEGMTLRDWFAGQTLAGAISDVSVNEYPVSEIAEYCYRMADAMLKAREVQS